MAPGIAGVLSERVIHVPDTIVINKHHGNVPPDAIYIGRGSKWGNPYSHMAGTTAKHRVATREEAIARYETWIRFQPQLLESLSELKEKTLVCFCKPKACHGDVLIKLIDELLY